jgi:hypothetical protein
LQIRSSLAIWYKSAPATEFNQQLKAGRELYTKT